MVIFIIISVLLGVYVLANKFSLSRNDVSPIPVTNQTANITVWKTKEFLITFPKNWELQPIGGGSCTTTRPSIIKPSQSDKYWIFICGPYQEKLVKLENFGISRGAGGPEYLDRQDTFIDNYPAVYSLSVYHFETGDEVHIDYLIKLNDQKSWNIGAKYYPENKVNEDDAVIKEIKSILQTFKFS